VRTIARREAAVPDVRARGLHGRIVDAALAMPGRTGAVKPRKNGARTQEAPTP